MFKRDQDHKVDRDRVEKIKTAIRLGFHHLDGAEAYSTEPELGHAIRESKVPRQELFVTTKVWQGLGNVSKAIGDSLKRLQLDYVDLFVCRAGESPED